MAIVVVWDKGVTGLAWADTEAEMETYRTHLKSLGFRVTVRRKYEWFLGQRFVRKGRVIRIKWEP